MKYKYASIRNMPYIKDFKEITDIFKQLSFTEQHSLSLKDRYN